MQEEASANTFLSRARAALKLQGLAPPVRRLVVGVVGGTVLLIGVALIFLPGPAFVVIPVGLAILATEFAWAQRYVRKGRELLDKARKKKEPKQTLTRERPPAKSS
jgi:tellurite resistance protein TerC